MAVLSVKLFIWQVMFRAGGQLVSRKRNLLDIQMLSADFTLPFIPVLFHFIGETCLWMVLCSEGPAAGGKYFSVGSEVPRPSVLLPSSPTGAAEECRGITRARITTNLEVEALNIEKEEQQAVF